MENYSFLTERVKYPNNQDKEFFDFAFNKTKYELLKAHASRKYYNSLSKEKKPKILKEIKKNFEAFKQNNENTKPKNYIKKRNSINPKNLNLHEFKLFEPKLNNQPINHKNITQYIDYHRLKSKSNRNLTFISLSKANKKYNKILDGFLNRDFIDTDEEMKTNSKKNLNKENENKKIDLLNVGKQKIHNCILKNKIIYDVKPLNKFNQKGYCSFNENMADESDLSSNKSNIHFCNDRSLNINYDNPFSNFLLYSRNKINKKKNNIYKINKNFTNSKLKIISLHLLMEDYDGKVPVTHMKTFFGDDGRDLIRGEKIKYTRKAIPVKVIKALSSQQVFKLGSKKYSEQNKIIKLKKFNVNNQYYLDRLYKTNEKKIKKAENKMKEFKDSIDKIMCEKQKEIMDILQK